MWGEKKVKSSCCLSLNGGDRLLMSHGRPCDTLLDVLVCGEAECVARSAASQGQTRFTSTKKENILAEWGENDNSLTLEFVFIEHTETFWPDTGTVSIY